MTCLANLTVSPCLGHTKSSAAEAKHCPQVTNECLGLLVGREIPFGIMPPMKYSKKKTS